MAYIVKSGTDDMWSGSDPGDADFPDLGRECVEDVAKAHRFDDVLDAASEAATYNQGALVLDDDGYIVLRTNGLGGMVVHQAHVKERP